MKKQPVEEEKIELSAAAPPMNRVPSSNPHPTRRARVLLIQGTAGTGKSLFGWRTIQKWDQQQQQQEQQQQQQPGKTPSGNLARSTATKHFQ
jgi:hypothetical protein